MEVAAVCKIIQSSTKRSILVKDSLAPCLVSPHTICSSHVRTSYRDVCLQEFVVKANLVQKIAGAALSCACGTCHRFFLRNALWHGQLLMYRNVVSDSA